MADQHRANLDIGCPFPHSTWKEEVVGGDAIESALPADELEAFRTSESPGSYIIENSTKKPAYQVPTKIVGGILGASYGDNNLFYRIWITPTEIDVGFITELLVYEIKIWNSWLNRDVEYTSIAITAQDGTSFEHPTLPYIITRSNSLITDMTIYKEGPPVQNTRYRLTIDGDNYYITIEGIRIINVVPDVQWSEPPSIEYSFQTVLYQDVNRFNEQRAPLTDIPDRKLNARYLLINNSAFSLFNLVSYGHDKVFGVPIYNEKLIPSSISTGTKIVQLVTPTDHMYNLINNSNFIMIVDHDSEISVIKEIDSISSNQINVVSDIAETFDNINSTYVYPVLIALVSAVSFTEETDNIQSVNLDFAEFRV